MNRCRPDKPPSPEPKNESKTVSTTKSKTNQVAALLLLLPLLLPVPTIIITILVVLLMSSVLPLIISTTPAAEIYLPPFIIDIPDSQEPALELTPITMKPKQEFMQIKDPRTTNGYKDPPPRRRYRMLQAIRCWKQAAYISKFKNKTDLLQYQDTVPIPNTYTIAHSDVFRDTPNLQPDWIPPCVDEPNLLERLTYTSSIAIASLVDSMDVLYNYKSMLSFTDEAALLTPAIIG